MHLGQGSWWQILVKQFQKIVCENGTNFEKPYSFLLNVGKNQDLFSNVRTSFYWKTQKNMSTINYDLDCKGKLQNTYVFPSNWCTRNITRMVVVEIVFVSLLLILIDKVLFFVNETSQIMTVVFGNRRLWLHGAAGKGANPKVHRLKKWICHILYIPWGNQNGVS